MKSKFYFFLRTYLGFSRRESRGFILLIPVFLLLYFIPNFYNKVLENENLEHYIEYQGVIDSMLEAGFHLYQPNFAKFNSPTLQDTTKKSSSYQRREAPMLKKLDFFEADSVVLQVVPGIGQKMAGRIVKFREGMGGLLHKDQLLDVYGMTPEVLDRVFEYFDFKPGLYRKLNINQADVFEIAKHPYINYGAAKVIVAYREQHGDYRKPEDLLQVKIFSEDWVERVSPYLIFE